VEPEDAAVETPAVAETLTEEPESLETSANLADVGLGKSVHEQVGSPKSAREQQDQGNRRASVVEDVARASVGSAKE